MRIPFDITLNTKTKYPVEIFEFVNLLSSAKNRPAGPSPAARTQHKDQVF